MSGRLPYAGVTVVEAISPQADDALFLAAGLAGRILADLGASVTCLEGRERRLDPSLHTFLTLRKAVVSESDASLVATACASNDIAIVDAVSLRRAGRDAFAPIVAALSLFGGEHADAETAGSAFTVSALSGLLAMVGDPEREPLRLGGHQEPFALGLAAYCGLAGALATPGAPRRTTIRASLAEALIWLNWKAVPLDDKTTSLPTRAGAKGEWQVLRCADGYAALVYQEPDWPRLRLALADERLEAVRFAARADRLEHAAELATIIEDRFLQMTRRQIHELARRHRLPLGPVWSLDEAVSDPHNQARALFEAVNGEASSTIVAPRLPVGWNGGSVQDMATIVEEAAQ
jgi:crotonobetainyl-CoA:carnitine CoA-transferase CaiB-like acyl-CoA transferase